MLEKARIIVHDTGEQIPVDFNPTELSLNYQAVTEGEGSNVQFQRFLADEFVVSLFFDTFDLQSDVRQFTGRITALMNPSRGTKERKKPPYVVFQWAGPLFGGIVTRVENKFTMFLPSGTPVRAELSVTFKPVVDEKHDLEAQGYFNCRRLWTVAENDRLYLIAQEAFGDGTLWRLIADANGICDPLGFPTAADLGRTLVIVDVHDETFNGAAHA